MKTAEITIDGAEGEGGGQMVRSSMALAVVTGTRLRLENIRAGRKKPGLKRQHLTAVRAAAEICGGQLTGDELGADWLEFVPGPANAGQYYFDVGTAGSATLVLQTVLPPLLTADGPSTVTVQGGTHNQWAPPFDFLERVYLPLVNRMGPSVRMDLKQHGFFPAGGGRIVVSIQPATSLTGFDLIERGLLQSRTATAIVAKLPEHIGDREVQRVVRKLRWKDDEGDVRMVAADCPGNVVFAETQYENVTHIETAFGRRGIRAEHVADEVSREMKRWLKGSVPVGEHLADQIMLPLALSAAAVSTAAGSSADQHGQRGGRYVTGPLSLHSKTHIDILQRFLDVDIQTTGTDEVTVAISPQS